MKRGTSFNLWAIQIINPNWWNIKIKVGSIIVRPVYRCLKEAPFYVCVCVGEGAAHAALCILPDGWVEGLRTRGGHGACFLCVGTRGPDNSLQIRQWRYSTGSCTKYRLPIRWRFVNGFELLSQHPRVHLLYMNFTIAFALRKRESLHHTIPLSFDAYYLHINILDFL